MVTAVQLCEYPKHDQIIHFKGVNLMDMNYASIKLLENVALAEVSASRPAWATNRKCTHTAHSFSETVDAVSKQRMFPL